MVQISDLSKTRSLAEKVCCALAKEYRIDLHLNVFDYTATANLPANRYKLMFERRRVFDEQKYFVGLVERTNGFRYKVLAEMQLHDSTEDKTIVAWFSQNRGEALLQKGEVVLP